MSSQGRSDPSDFLGAANRDDVAAIVIIFARSFGPMHSSFKLYTRLWSLAKVGGRSSKEGTGTDG